MSFETAAKRLSADVLSFAAGIVVGEEGRVAARHGRDRRGHGHRRRRHPPRLVRGARPGWPAGSTTARWSTPATAGTSTRPRRCSTATRSARRSAAGDEGLDRGFAGLRVAIVGDIRHSRVARSADRRLAALGRRGHPGGAGDPAAPVARGLAGRRRSATTSTPSCPKADVVYLLRLQTERGSGAFVPVAARVHRRLRPDRAPGRPAADRAPSSCIPGPMVRGVEIAVEVAELPAVADHRQVSNGVAVRMAVLFLLLGQGPVGGRRAVPDRAATGRAVRPADRGHPGRHGGRRRPASAGPTCVVADGTGWPRWATDLDVPAGRHRARRRRAAWWPRAWSTCTPICASRGARRPRPSRPGARAAALGGYTAVVAMPNTDPPLDSAEAVRERARAGATAPCAEVAVAGAITVGRAGERLAPMAELAALGVRLFTDDGAGVQSAGLMRRALEYARGLGVTLAQHCEDAHAGRRRRHARGGVVEPAGRARACRPRPRR